MRLSNEIIEKILESNELQLKLALALNRHQASIKRLAGKNDTNNLLTNPASTNILKEESGLSMEQILVDEKVEV